MVELRTMYEESQFWKNVTSDVVDGNVSIGMSNEVKALSSHGNVSMDYNLVCNGTFKSLMSGDDKLVAEALQQGFYTEMKSKMPADTWQGIRQYLASNFLAGGDLETLASWMMCCNGSNVKMNLRKEKIENFIGRNFSGTESLSWNVKQ